MKMRKTQGAALLLALILTALCAGPARATTVDDRLNARLDVYINTLNATPPTDDIGKLSYALAVFKRYAFRDPLTRDAEKTQANTYVSQVHIGTIVDALVNPYIMRLFVDPVMYAHLSAANRTQIETELWNNVKSKSTLAVAQGSVWGNMLGGSENTRACERSTYLLALQVLKPIKGGGTLLNDGQSIDTHLAAWKKYFFELLRQRAREGLMGEIASAYNELTIRAWYIIADFCEDASLRELARKAIDLFWADHVTEFHMATGLRRTVALTRYYKYTMDASDQIFRELGYCYDWADSVVNFSSENLDKGVSAYRPPINLATIARNDQRAPYLSTSRRFGRTSGEGYGFGTNNASDIRRDVWWTPDYAMGGLTFRTDANNIYRYAENRVMGLGFANPASKWDKILFYGTNHLNDEDTVIEHWYFEVSGVCRKNCLVAARDRNSETPYTRVMIKNGPLVTNLDETSVPGWVFTWTAGSLPGTEVYVGIKIANGGYTKYTFSNHIVLHLNNPNSPVIFESMAKSEMTPPYNDFTWFKAFCSLMSFNYDTGAQKLTYSSLAGNAFEYWANSSTLPKVDGATVNLNPARTYDTPYLKMDHGSDVATYGDGFTTTTLDFNYKDSPLWDDYQTKALWHMETIASNLVSDDDLFATTRNNDLTISGAVVNTANDVNTALADCLYFDGVNDKGTAAYSATGPKGWAAYPSAKIDFWFKPTQVTASGAIVNAVATWEFQQVNNDLKMWVWYPNCSFWPHTLIVTNGATSNVWHHVTGTISTSGGTSTITLQVDNLAPQTMSGTAMSLNNAALVVGSTGSSRWFKGYVDDVKVRIHNLE